MNKSELIKKIEHLDKEAKEAFSYNKRVLDAHQVVSNQLAQYVREEEDRLRNLKENFMLQVNTLRQDAVKLNNEYRQELHSLRSDWSKTFLFNEPVAVLPVQKIQ